MKVSFKVSAKVAAIILPLFFLLGIVITMMTGYWATENSKEPAKYTTGELTGLSNPADIRGSYSLEDLEKSFEVPVAVLAEAFGFSNRPNPASIQIKELEEIFGEIEGMEVGTDSVRYFVALYKGQPYITEEGTGLPRPAFEILKSQGKLSEKQISDLEPYIIDIDVSLITEAGEPAEAGESTEEEHALSADVEIKGNTLFSDLYSWGFTEDQVLIALDGLPLGARSATIRDYCNEQGVEFSIVKEKLLEMLE